MDPLLIATIALGALLLISLLLWTGARRSRRATRRSLAGAQADLSSTLQSLQSVQLGEREAAWAADRSSRRLERLTVDLTKAEHEAERLESDLDDLRTRLGAADRDLAGVREAHDVAETRIVELEVELAQLRLESSDETERIAGLEQRLTSVVRERDRLQATVQRSEQLEDELAALGRVHVELSALRDENAALRSGLSVPATNMANEAQELDDLGDQLGALRDQMSRDRADSDRKVAAAEAEAASARQRLADLQSASGDGAPSPVHSVAVADLEEKLAAVTAARAAEQQTAAQRITSLERLHIDIAERDRQIARLEDEVASLNTTPIASDRTVSPASSTDGGGPTPDPSTYAVWDATMRDRVHAAVADATGRLETEVAHLRLVITEKERLLAERTGPPAPSRPAKPLTITAIRGIGPVIAGILAGHGITTLDDVAALVDADIDRLSEEMPVYPERIRADDWVGQARTLLA
jgi:predicted flap endonuclease-1-like 5' DNA nuclease/chromosome segregation ATPase